MTGITGRGVAGADSAPAIGDFVTASDETTTLPNSRTLIAGSNIVFSDAVANQRSVSVRTPLVDLGVSFQTPDTGFSITPANTVSHLQLNPAGLLATGTITLPDNPADGQLFSAASTQTITLLTVNASAGESIRSAPTTLVGGAGFAYWFRATDNTWYRRY